MRPPAGGTAMWSPVGTRNWPPSAKWMVKGTKGAACASFRISPVITNEARYSGMVSRAREQEHIPQLTLRVSDGGSRVFDLERGGGPAVHCTRLVRRFLSHLLSHARTKGATTHQPRAERSAALGNAITQQMFRALKARHRSEFGAFSATACVGDTQTQGAASFCPGLTSSGAFGATLDRVDQNAHCLRRFLSPNSVNKRRILRFIRRER